VRRPQARTTYLIYVLGEGFAFYLMSTIYSVFLVLVLDLNPLQLLLLGTVVEATYLVFEVPTGVVADTVSRRLSVVIGLAGTGVAFLVLSGSPSFLWAMVSQAIWGVFATFVSGADVAWLTDEVGEDVARPLYLRYDQFGMVGALAGIVASVALATIDLRLPIALSGVGFLILAVFMALSMREEGFRPRERAPGERLHTSLSSTFKEGTSAVRAHHVLLLILAVAALHGASTEGFDRLADFHLLRDIGLPSFGDLDPVLWFGVLDAVALLLGIAGLAVLRRRAHLNGHATVARILMGIDALLIVSAVVFGLAGSFWVAIAMFWIVGMLRSVRYPIFTAWINQGLDPGIRATINSLGSQSDAIGQAAGGPVLGAIAKGVSTPAALVTSALLAAPALLLYVRAIRRGSVGTLRPEEIEPALNVDEESAEAEIPEGPHVPPGALDSD
jgi:DHA3 family tetracycline resistance protein-like MFS transporter